MASSKDNKEWLSTSDVAKRCGVTVPTVRIWIDTGKLPASVFRTARKVWHEDVEAFIRASRKGAGSVTKELEPCPHCGAGEDILDTLYDKPTNTHSIFCNGCYITFAGQASWARGELIAAWNRRAKR